MALTTVIFLKNEDYRVRVGSLVGLEGVNRPIKTNTQTFIKFTLRHCCSGGRHCQARTAALPHLQTTSSHSSKSMNKNLDRKNFLAYCRYDNHISRARSGRNTTHK